MNKYTYEQKQDIIIRYANGEPIAKIVSNYQMPRITIYSWIKENQNSNTGKKRA